MDGLTDGQVVGGLLFVVAPLAVLVLALAEQRVRSRRAVRARGAGTSTRARRRRATWGDQAREAGRTALRGGSLTWLG